MANHKKNVLIAYMPNYKDLDIARDKNWYRIPTDIKRVPQNVKNSSLDIIAFYFPKIFKDYAFRVVFYGIVEKIEIASRKQLFKNEPPNPKSNRIYYKIKFKKLLRLPHPIYSRRKRRIVFISTTVDRFNNAVEINDLFLESPIEELLWEAFKKHNIIAERQFLEKVKGENFFLDFALFCRKGNLDVECDGDAYHLKAEEVKRDKKRDNLLLSCGWNILRYCTEDIKYKMEDTIYQLKETINKYGGIEDPLSNKYLFFPDKSQEDNLFQF